MFADHINRIRDAVSNQFSLENLAAWIEKNTYLNGRNYSFKGYEFQKTILADTAQTSIIVKCAQVGLSELAYRYAVATCCTQDDWNLIYTFPTSTDSQLNCRQRIDPMIAASPELSRLIDVNQNNSEVKKFGANSFLMFKGTKSETQALSTPANAVIHDEVDKSDLANMSTYVSRLQNRPHKIRKMFSTPTIEKFGISKEAETSRRHKHLAQCEHCNHWYIPNYFEDIIVPGWDKPLEEITKRNIHLTRWKEATLLCPKCKRPQKLHHSRMQFVCENVNEHHEANSWFISPFSAHEVISLPKVPNSTAAYLVEVSTKYEKYSEFKNQSLGITAEDKNEQLVASDFNHLNADLNSTNFHCMGVDIGQICHITVGRETLEGQFIVVHRERCYLAQVEARTLALTAQYRVIMTVFDRQPETLLVDRLVSTRKNTYGAMFVTAKAMGMYKVVEEEEDEETGKLLTKQVKVSRTIALDALRDAIKTGKFVFQSDEHDELFIQQMTSLKREQKFEKNEFVFIWTKTGDEDDHFHFSLLYLYLACKLRTMGMSFGVDKAVVPLVSVINGPQYQTSTPVARPIIRLS